jgi:hypothetical protein
MAVSTTLNGELVIITNRDTGVKSITYEFLYDSYVFNIRTWPNGMPLTIVTLPMSDVGHRLFLDKYIGLGSVGYLTRYERKVLLGNARPPVVVESPYALIEAVSTNVGYVGYIDSDILKYSGTDNIEVLNIQ